MDEPARADLHVHSEFSWDAPNGSMEETCRRAEAFGLPASAFTDHADYRKGGGRFDPAKYSKVIDRCRSKFPSLKILSGVELGEPHRFQKQGEDLLRSYPFDLVLGSCHSIEVDGTLTFIGDKGTLEPEVAPDNVRAFFQETLDLVERAPVFAALTHLDYPKRDWPHGALPYSDDDFEEEIRAVLVAAASAGLALEINTNGGRLEYGPCPSPTVLAWWADSGGKAITIGSDAHSPKSLARGHEVASGIAEALGFRRDANRFGFWFK